jgi:hypothetical protein
MDAVITKDHMTVLRYPVKISGNTCCKPKQCTKFYKSGIHNNFLSIFYKITKKTNQIG